MIMKEATRIAELEKAKKKAAPAPASAVEKKKEEFKPTFNKPKLVK